MRTEQQREETSHMIGLFLGLILAIVTFAVFIHFHHGIIGLLVSIFLFYFYFIAIALIVESVMEKNDKKRENRLLNKPHNRDYDVSLKIIETMATVDGFIFMDMNKGCVYSHNESFLSLFSKQTNTLIQDAYYIRVVVESVPVSTGVKYILNPESYIRDPFDAFVESLFDTKTPSEYQRMVADAFVDCADTKELRFCKISFLYPIFAFFEGLSNDEVILIGKAVEKYKS